MQQNLEMWAGWAIMKSFYNFFELHLNQKSIKDVVTITYSFVS